MRKTARQIFLLLFSGLLLCVMNLSVLAAEQLPDSKQKGSITITMKDMKTGKPVAGGSLCLWQAAELVEKDGKVSFVFTDTFSEIGFSLEDIQSETLAGKLAEYVDKNNIKGVVSSVGSDGTVSFDDLVPGVYLVTQQKAAKGFLAVKPFLVSIPERLSQEGWVYDVDASPKVEPDKGKEEPGKPDKPRKPSSPNENPGSSVPPIPATVSVKLPQTGQLNWPVPVLSIAGLILFAVGWRMCSTEEKQNYEV